MLKAIIHGFAVGAGLIIAIGPQNTFVITQGIKREHVFLCALICTLTDVILISFGIIGLGALIRLHPAFVEIARWFGAAFLMYHAIFAFRAAIHPSTLKIDRRKKGKKKSAKNIIVILLGLSFLNPHAYLDTVVLIGSIAAQKIGVAKYWFGLGTMLASACWFFSIAYGAKTLTPIFASKHSWRILDLFVGLTMTTIAIILIK